MYISDFFYIRKTNKMTLFGNIFIERPSYMCVTETIPGQAMLKCSQPSQIMPLHSQSHPFLVSCTFHTIPILCIFNLDNFYFLVELW